MTTEITLSSTDRVLVTVYSSAALSAKDAVMLDTGSSQNIPCVQKCGATAGTISRVFGVLVEDVSTGGYGACCIHGPALVTVNSAVTVKGAVTLTYGTAGVLGRVSPMAFTSGAIATSDYLGWAIKAAGSGSVTEIFVNTPHQS